MPYYLKPLQLNLLLLTDSRLLLCYVDLLLDCIHPIQIGKQKTSAVSLDTMTPYLFTSRSSKDPAFSTSPSTSTVIVSRSNSSGSIGENLGSLEDALTAL